MIRTRDASRTEQRRLNAIKLRLDLRQRSTSRIAGPFMAQFLARVFVAVMPVRLIEAIEPFLLSLGARSNFIADFLDDLLEALMHRGQKVGNLNAGAGRSWVSRAFGGAIPSARTGMSLGDGPSLVIVLPGADWRCGLHDGYEADERYWLCLGRQRLPPPETAGRLVESSTFRELPDHELGAAMRQEAARYLRVIGELIPDLADRILVNEVGLENQLTNEISRMVQQATDAASACADLSPGRVMVLTGDHDADAIVAALLEAGFPQEAISVVPASPRLSCNLRQAVPSGFSRIQDVLKLYSQHEVQASRPSLTGGVVVLAGRNKRHLPRAVDAMKALSDRVSVDFLVPISSFGRETLGIAWKLARRQPRRFRIRFVRSHHFFLPVRGETSAPSGLLRSDLPGNSTEGTVRAAAKLGAILFLDHYLLPFLATAEGLEDSFRQWQPKAVVLIPGTTPIGQVAAGAARQASVPSWQVQTLLTQADGREYRPIADMIGVIDTSQSRLFEDYFGVAPERLHCVGYLSFHPPGDVVSVEPDEADPVDVIFVSQPIPGLAVDCAEMIAEALRLTEGLRCHVYSHPVETDEQVAMLVEVASGVPDGRMVWKGRGTSDDVMRSARVTICMYSNIGIQAALMGRDVIVAKPQGTEYPVRFDEMGIALLADNPARLMALFSDLLSNGQQFRGLSVTRQRYFAHNPQLDNANNAENFARLVLGHV